MKKKAIDEVLTIGEAAELWNLPITTIKQWCTGREDKNILPKFNAGECRKSGKFWLVTKAGMTRIAGPEPNNNQ